MIDRRTISKPVTRGRIRQLVGREYFILRRKFNWWNRASGYANTRTAQKLPFPVITHRSFLLRPLKDVEMYLQRNKITNLHLAISNIDGLIIQPGETFSVWRRSAD